MHIFIFTTALYFITAIFSGLNNESFEQSVKQTTDVKVVVLEKCKIVTKLLARQCRRLFTSKMQIATRNELTCGILPQTKDNS